MSGNPSKGTEFLWEETCSEGNWDCSNTLKTRELTEVPTHTEQQWCLQGRKWEFYVSITETMRFSLGFFLLWRLEQKEEGKKPVGKSE